MVDPTNGVVALSGTSVGDAASFTCNPGFELVGADTIVCGNDGRWSEKPPHCNNCKIGIYNSKASVEALYNMNNTCFNTV